MELEKKEGTSTSENNEVLQQTPEGNIQEVITVDASTEEVSDETDLGNEEETIENESSEIQPNEKSESVEKESKTEETLPFDDVLKHLNSGKKVKIKGEDAYYFTLENGRLKRFSKESDDYIDSSSLFVHQEKEFELID